MSDLTSDPSDPRLGRGVDTEPGPQNAAYLVLSEEERARGDSCARYARATGMTRAARSRP